jgi:hypothetical protein
VPILHRFQGKGGFARLKFQTLKVFRLEAVGFRSDESSVRSAPPKVDTAGPKKLARQTTESPDDMTGIAALKSRAGQLKQELLESLIRMRSSSVRESRVYGVTRQSAPSTS